MGWVPPRWSEEGGGGFQRTVCQLVDWSDSKWSVEAASSSSLTLPWKRTSGSRTKRCAMWRASTPSTPSSTSRWYAASSKGASMSLYWLVAEKGSSPPLWLQIYMEIES